MAPAEPQQKPRGAGKGGTIGVMSQLFVLVHAPVLGPAGWQPVAEELSLAGHAVVVPVLTNFTAGGPPYAPRLVALAAEQVTARPRDRVILVTHSGAGVFAAQLSAAIGAGATDVTTAFVDAGLPGPTGGGPVVDGEFLPYLRKIASDGLVPPWHQWWPGEDLSPLFPDESSQHAVTSQARPLPLAFFEEALPPAPQNWPPRRAGYLLFSESYRQQARQAALLGWPVRELPGQHLHMLADPAAVAAAIVDLADRR
jgi:alpha/beta hydrolase family protein